MGIKFRVEFMVKRYLRRGLGVEGTRNGVRYKGVSMFVYRDCLFDTDRHVQTERYDDVEVGIRRINFKDVSFPTHM